MVGGKKTIAIIQARMNSSRLPGKVMMRLGGRTILERTVERTKESEMLDEVWVATSDKHFDDIIQSVARHIGANVFRGSLDDVLNRFYVCANRSGADVIVRVTADNPLTEPRLIDIGVAKLMEGYDYVAFDNIPYGSGVEVFTMKALSRAEKHSRNAEEREHLTLYMKKNSDQFKTCIISNSVHSIIRPDIRVTIDDLEDYARLYKAFQHISKTRGSIGLEDVISYFDSNHPADKTRV